jgi:hypothetical protein
VLCGPPIVVKLTLPVLEDLGFADDAIFTTLENRMKCGVGKCGRCNIGSVYVCKDGPVFTAAQIKALPQEFSEGRPSRPARSPTGGAERRPSVAFRKDHIRVWPTPRPRT